MHSPALPEHSAPLPPERSCLDCSAFGGKRAEELKCLRDQIILLSQQLQMLQAGQIGCSASERASRIGYCQQQILLLQSQLEAGVSGPTKDAERCKGGQFCYLGRFVVTFCTSPGRPFMQRLGVMNNT